MNYITNSFKTIFHYYLDMTPKEVLQAKQNTFFINDNLKINKFAYAYFLDRYIVANQNEQQTIDSLKRYQWFAGSLTAELFIQNLRNFLDSPQSLFLTTPIKAHIRDFIIALQHSETQGHLIDLVRSTDLKLIFLILTGIDIGGNVNAEPLEIQKITQETLNQLNQMKEGDKRIFLLGDLFHETRMLIEKQNEGWEISYIDPALATYKNFKNSQQSPILKNAFWDKIYDLKLQSNKILDLANHLESQLGEEAQDIEKIKLMKEQKKNTCHFRGLLGILKKMCLSDSNLIAETVLSDWKPFKLAFGSFLLENPSLNSEMKTLAANQQKHRNANQEKRDLFRNMINSGKYEEVVKNYLDALKILGSDTKLLQNTTPLEMLLYLDSRYIFNLKNNSIRLETIEQKLKDLNDPCLDLSLMTFYNSFNEEQRVWAKELKAEMYKAQFKPGFLTATVTNNQFQNTLLNFKPLKKEITLDWLSKVILDPFLLGNLNQKPIFVILLIQSIFMGEVKKVKKLYERMPPEDQKVLLDTLKLFVSDNIFSPQNDYFSPHSLPAVEFNDHPLDPTLREMQMKKLA